MPAEGDEGADAEEEEELPDDRQPKYMNVELPGLRGAWSAQVSYIMENNVTEKGDAHLYVMTNHEFADHPDQAADFSRNFVKMLAEAVRETVDAEAWRDEKFPARTGTFVKQVNYRSVTTSGCRARRAMAVRCSLPPSRSAPWAPRRSRAT